MILGLKLRNIRPLSNEEKALLLIENLQTNDWLDLVNSFDYPNTIPKSSYFRLLEFDRKDQKEVLDRLRPLTTTKGIKVTNFLFLNSDHFTLLKYEIQ